ncbi:MAG TPA: hypothetical protein VJ842_11345 [Pyrinomonadaceae bacterium]|nr:hypothetical protein [Pyrinomonadaceae bacterium]
MNMLNRILLNSDSPMDAQMYFFKLLAERYALGGQFGWAMMFGFSYLKMRETYTSYRRDKNLIRRSTFTWSQELFIIAHEIAHLIIKNPGRFISLPQRDSSSTEKGEGNYENYDVVIRSLAEQFKLGRIDYDMFMPSSDNPFAKMLLNNPDFSMSSDIREECCCDVLATIMLISVLKQDKGIDFSDVLIAIAMCLRHLRVLGFVELMYSKAWFAEQSGNKPLIHGLLLRTSNIREFMRALAGVHIEGVELRVGYDMIQMAEHYEKVIDDPVMFSVADKIKNLMNVPELNKLNTDNPKITLREVGEITGFFETIS